MAEAETKETETKETAERETPEKEETPEVEVKETKATETKETKETEEKPEPEGEKKTPWFQRRIDELTREKHEARRQTEALQQRLVELEAAVKGQQTGEKPAAPVEAKFDEARVNALAEEKARAIEFTKECNRIYESGIKEYADFGKSLEQFTQLGGLNSPSGANLVAASMETPDPHKVLYALSKDLDEASRLMSLPPVRQAAALMRYASGLSEKPAKSKAPAPIKPINGTAKGESNMEDDSMTMEDWIAARNRQLETKRKRA